MQSPLTICFFGVFLVTAGALRDYRTRPRGSISAVCLCCRIFLKRDGQKNPGTMAGAELVGIYRHPCAFADTPGR